MRRAAKTTLYARDQHDRLGVPLRFIPGNHDLGDNPSPGHEAAPPIAEDYRARFCRLFGEDWWSHDRDAWRLVGINAQLLGSGLDAEAAQWDFLETAFAAARRPIALFVTSRSTTVIRQGSTRRPIATSHPSRGAVW
jgi:hypothetical protein